MNTCKQTENTHKVIALAASPSKGRNSDSMLDAFISGIKEQNSKIEIEKIYLNEMTIHTYKYEISKCPCDDENEFGKLAAQLCSVDGVVIATPTYNFSVPAALKNFIDRLRFVALDMTKRNFLNQPVGQLQHLRLFNLVSGGTPTYAQRFMFFAYPGFWLRLVFMYYGARKINSFYSGDVKTFENKKVLAKCKKLGKKYAKKIS